MDTRTRHAGRGLAVRCAALLVMIACACVGLPPSPPQQGDTTSGGGSTDDGVPPTSGQGTASGADDTNETNSSCGDGVVEAPEECDLGELNGTGEYCTADCRTNACGDGYVGPGELCDDGNQNNDDSCTTDCGPASCGDGVVQPPETCDEAGDNSETGSCLPSCIEASCGDQLIHEGVETCDSDNIGRQSCEDLGFSGGVLLCAADCMDYDTSNCYACGDGALDPGEQCDGAMLDGETCLTQEFDDGTLACSELCTFDTSGCVSFACGNGLIDGSDVCDGDDLGGATCMSEGFDGGTLTCSAGCTFDADGCYACGDGAVNPGEECDGAQLGGATCDALAMGGQTASGGTPACNGSCMLTEGTCTFCGDGMREGTELCDGAQLGGATCQMFAMPGDTASGGTPACNAICMPTVGTCTFCGDNSQEGTEECDGTDLNGGQCSSPLAAGPGHSGTLSCAANCTYDITDCCLNGGQPCMGMNALCCDGSCNQAGGTQC